MERSRIKNVFMDFYPGPKSPHYTMVKRDHPILFEDIMRLFNGYRSFLAIIHYPMPRTTKAEKTFIKYSSMVSRSYFINCWSTLEELTWSFLEYLNVAERFIHNFPFPSQSGPKYYYKLDFFDSMNLLHLSVDGIFHQAIPTQKDRDLLKDEWLRRYGIDTLHLMSKDFKDWRTTIHKIDDFLTAASLFP
jgi:very-short-patch-repair endonuclease